MQQDRLVSPESERSWIPIPASTFSFCNALSSKAWLLIELDPIYKLSMYMSTENMIILKLNGNAKYKS